MSGQLDNHNNIVLGDFLIDRVLTLSQIQVTLAKLFDVSESEICVVEDINNVKFDSVPQLVCAVYQTKGDFRQLLSLYPHRLHLELFNGMAIAKQLCRQLSCQCLLPSNDVNPFSYWLIHETGMEQFVYIDPEKESQNEYIIAHFANA